MLADLANGGAVTGRWPPGNDAVAALPQPVKSAKNSVNNTQAVRWESFT